MEEELEERKEAATSCSSIDRDHEVISTDILTASLEHRRTPSPSAVSPGAAAIAAPPTHGTSGGTSGSTHTLPVADDIIAAAGSLSAANVSGGGSVVAGVVGEDDEEEQEDEEEEVDDDDEVDEVEDGDVGVDGEGDTDEDAEGGDIVFKESRFYVAPIPAFGLRE